MKANFYTESILYWLARGVSGLAQRIPPTQRCALGAGMGAGIHAITARRRIVAMDNLRAAFGDRYTPREYQRIIREMSRNLGMTLMEVAAIPQIDRAYADRWITPSPGSRDRLETALKQGRGVILMTGHFGNWELASIVGALNDYPMLVLAREQGWPRLNRLLTQYRQSRGCRVVTKGFAVRELIHGLREGRIIGILADQDAGKNGVLSPLFGRLASTASGTIELSLKTGAPILPVFMVREKGPAHRMIVEEPLAVPAQGTEEDRVRAGIAAYLRVLERHVREHPAQWLWLHRRWKSTPERRILIFGDGKAGHAAQANALAEKLETAWKEKTAGDPRLKGVHVPLVSRASVEIRYRHPIRRAVLTLVSAAAPRWFTGGDRWLKWALTPESHRAIRSVHADWSISCGASTAPVNLLWSRAIRARPIHITRTAVPSWRRFDLAVIPRHDWKGKPAPARALTVDGAMVSVFHSNGWGTGQRAIGLLIGGPARGVPMNPGDLERAVDGVAEAAEKLDAVLLVTTSRRTPAELEEFLERKWSAHPRCRLLVLVNRNQTGGLGSTQEAVPCIFSAADALVVSGDSISMVSEAVSTGKPVVSFSPGRGTKYDRFLRGMDSGGKLRLVEPAQVGGTVAELLKAPDSSLRTPPSDPVLERLIRWV